MHAAQVSHLSGVFFLETKRTQVLNRPLCNTRRLGVPLSLPVNLAREGRLAVAEYFRSQRPEPVFSYEC